MSAIPEVKWVAPPPPDTTGLGQFLVERPHKDHPYEADAYRLASLKHVLWVWLDPHECPFCHAIAYMVPVHCCQAFAEHFGIDDPYKGPRQICSSQGRLIE